MKAISISEFRKRCLSLIDDLPDQGLLITRHGKAVAKIIPLHRSCAELIGSAPHLLYDNDDGLFAAGVHWDADSYAFR
jgi:antitoxin (DNA-binding transcriptional repressor) of toxin-antitoxin stability system